MIDLATAESIIELVAKGLTVVETLVQTGKDVLPTITALKNVVVGGEDVTQAELDALEAHLDAQLDEFDKDLPPDDTV